MESLKRRVSIEQRYEREASIAEEFDVMVVRGLWNTLLKLGSALRLLIRCRYRQGMDADLKKAVDDVHNLFEELYSELYQHRIEHVPLEKQVAIQLYAILLTIKHVL